MSPEMRRAQDQNVRLGPRATDEYERISPQNSSRSTLLATVKSCHPRFMHPTINVEVYPLQVHRQSLLKDQQAFNSLSVSALPEMLRPPDHNFVLGLIRFALASKDKILTLRVLASALNISPRLTSNCGLSVSIDALSINSARYTTITTTSRDIPRQDVTQL